jgi:hypothetical protein
MAYQRSVVEGMFSDSTLTNRGWSHLNLRARQGWLAYLPDLNAAYRALISSQLMAFHHAARYSGRRLLYFK